MSLPDIDFDRIRHHHGTQADAFEELCCQLASDEPIADRVRFDRKGRGGDGGVECFVTHADGAETGWQVKYYSDFASMIGSLDGSLTRALARHPAMRRFIACFPFDISDPRRDGVHTALSKWDAWREGRIREAASSGRVIEIDWWDAHRLKLRLTDSTPRSAGRVAFWFDQEMLTNAWFKKAFERTKAGLGDRYSPESHVDLPVRQTILGSLRDPTIFGDLKALASKIETRLAPAEDEATRPVVAAASALASELRRLAAETATPFPLDALVARIDVALGSTLGWIETRRGTEEIESPSREMVAIHRLAEVLRSVRRDLDEDRWRHLDIRAFLVVGDAGTGKSHLLADACAYQLAQGRPALMVLGGKLPDAEPWGEIRRDLDLPHHLQTKQFLGALNAAGEASGVRTLIAIDALNEKNGQQIWPERLPGLLNDLRDFPWIAVVLSCRTTYEPIVVPATLDRTRLPRVDHVGFDDEDVIRYLARRGISVPESPVQLDELCNPLFLRLTCDALRADGEVLLPENLGSISDVLSLYHGAVARRVDGALGTAPRRELAAKATRLLAREMAAKGRGQVGFERADALVRAVHDGDDLGRDLLFQLENEGLLSVEQDDVSSPGADQVVRFTFERVGDHAIVSDLLDRSLVVGARSPACAAGTPLRDALSDPGSEIVEGLLEALAVQLPERFGVELADLPGLPDGLWLTAPFEHSLLARRPDAFTARTWELCVALGDEASRLETLIALATEPHHPFNVRFLDEALRARPMPDRDAWWSVHLATSRRAQNLVRWAWNVDQSRVVPERAELAATQLAWFLSASSRVLRDRATKALVALFADRGLLAFQIWDSFRLVDDVYVTERVVAALYGAALQGRWADSELMTVALSLYWHLFADRAPPANALLRQHAAGLIAYARDRGATVETLERADLEGPFRSAWPIEQVPDEIIAGFTRSRSDGFLARNEIVASCDNGDFARYVLESVVKDWSPAPIGTDPLPTIDDLRATWFARFDASATPEMKQAHDALVRTMAQEHGDRGFLNPDARKRIEAAKAHFKAVVGPEAFEHWRTQAEHWRAGGRASRWARRGPAEFNLGWARRWVTMRAHALGWTQERHGAFDRGRRSDRHRHDVERIGKKYQWLALYELAARMADNLEPLPDRGAYDRLRNIDPSLLLDRTQDDGWRRFDSKAFWIGAEPGLTARTPAEAIAWLHGSDDILDGDDNIAVTSPFDGRDWLVLKGFETWSGPTDEMHCEAWRRVGCMVVRKEDFSAALSMLIAESLTDPSALPSAEGADFGILLGEFPWRTLDPDHDDWIEDWQVRGRWGEGVPTLTVRPTTAEYIAEANGYDGSISENINLHLPAKWLMDGLGLRLTDGRSIEYRDAGGTTRFMDPSVSMNGRSAALVDRAAFLDLLQRQGLIAIWAVAGEKSAYGETRSEGFGGRLAFTRLFFSHGNDLVDLERFESFAKPSKKQLAAFLGEPEPEGEEEEEEEEDDSS
ncbi:hypothetical protein [Sphingomonas sp. PR090111-T3T-6A]|uniref:hypothetical protein n=1 Tax=Sphingomonas sp. PR090111-T3T-6A TaxID=685778 RepID=UPI000376D00C|nr:hypothetical protein [Sphingomonas sp. PR090111-T3T-6A]